MAGGEPRDVVNRWSTSGSGSKTRTGARPIPQTSQQGAEGLCGDYTNEDGSCSGWGRPGTPRAAGNLVSPRHSRPLTPRHTGSAASPRHSQFRSPRGQSPRGHQQSPREPGPLSLAFNMPLPDEGGYIDSDEPHMASTHDSRSAKQQHVQPQGRDTHAPRSEGRKVPLLPLSSLGLAKSRPEVHGKAHLHQQPLQMSGAKFQGSMHAEQRQADLSYSEDDLTQNEQRQSGTEPGHDATISTVSNSVSEATEKSGAAVWSALEEAYCGSEDELQLSALHADTHESLASEYSLQGRSGIPHPSGSTERDSDNTAEGGTDSREPAEEEGRMTRACRILGDISDILAQQNASALDASCTVSAGTVLPASLEHKTVVMSQQMMGLAVQDGTQQPDNIIFPSEPAQFTASETPAGTCHAQLHDRTTASHTQTFSEQLCSASAPARLEHSSPQQTPRVGLSAILDTAPDEARMLSNLPAISSQQGGPSQHGDGLLWMGINMLTADDVSAREQAAAAAHPDAQHSGSAFSLTSHLSTKSDYSQPSLGDKSSTAAVMVEGPASAPDFVRDPVHKVVSGLTAQLKGKGLVGGRGLQAGAKGERVGAFWPEGGDRMRVIVQRGYLEPESEAEDFEDASDKFFGDMSLSSGSDPAGMHDVSNSSSSGSANVSPTALVYSDKHSVCENAQDPQPSAVTPEATEALMSIIASVSEASGAESITDAEQVMDSTSTQSAFAATEALAMAADLQVTQEAEHSEKACASVGEVDTEAANCATETITKQDAAEMEPSDAIQEGDILYKLEMTVQQPPGSCTPPASQQRQSELATPSPDRKCWSPSLGPMLEETVGALFAATPVKDFSGENDV